MDNRGLLLLAFLFCIYTLNVYAEIELVCKGESLDEDYKFLEHLDMGYKNPKPLDIIKKNTLCGIQTICRSIMIMTAPTDKCTYNDLQTLRTTVESFYKLSQDTLVIVYSMNAVLDRNVLYPLWLFSLYVKDNYFEWRFNTIPLVAKVHKMIIKKLTKFMKDCPANNEFDVTNPKSQFYFKISGGHDNNSNLEHFANRIREHFDRIRPKLTEVTGENYKRMNPANLLVGTECILDFDDTFGQIQNVYGITIKWEDAAIKLWYAYKEAKQCVNLLNGLQGIKKYRNLYFTMIKMVMYRFLWIHFLVVTEDNRLDLNNAMYEKVNDFGNITGLNDDDKAFVEAVKFLHNERPLPEVSEAAIEHIKKELKESGSFFEGSEVLNIVKEDVPMIYNKVTMHEKEEEPLTDIQKNLKLVVWFVEEIKEVLRYVDPGFVKSVLEM